MQAYNYQHNHIAPAPASSKALIKLKTDKLIPSGFAPQPQSYSHRPAIKFNNSQSNLVHNTYTSTPNTIPWQRSTSPGFANSVASIPRPQSTQSHANQPYIHQQGNSSYSISNSQVGQLNNQPNYGSYAGLNRNQQLKPLSAFLKSNHISTNGDLSRVRSSSASQFSTIDQDRRISQLEAKLGDYSDQIIQSNTRLSEKEKRVTELESQLYGLRQRNAQFQLKLQQIQEGDEYRRRRLNDLEIENKLLYTQKVQAEKMVHLSQQKIQNLQTSLDKILKIKNIQIDQLNQSCNELSKEVQLLYEKHQLQTESLKNNLTSQQQAAKQNQAEFENLLQKVKKFEMNKEITDGEHQQHIKKIMDQQKTIQLLEAENKALKTDLSSHIQRVEDLEKRYFIESKQNLSMKTEVQRLSAELMNSKKMADQQIEFLSAKVEQAGHQKQRLMQQIQLTKAVIIKRNTLFERHVIYELKQQNDKLWSRLIQHSDSNANLRESSPDYWDKVYCGEANSSPVVSHIPAGNVQPPASNIKTGSVQNGKKFEDQYYGFIRELEQQSEKTGQIISNLNKKAAMHQEEDICFYRDKCVNLEKIVEDHLQINLNLKDQLQKLKSTNFNSNPTSAQVVFLKNQLQKQRILNQTLNRSLELFKQEYEQKFQAAQHRVQQIQKSSKPLENDPSIMVIDILRKQNALLEQKNHDLIIENSSLNVKVSQANRWQALYLDMKRKCEQMSPIASLKEDNENKIMESRIKENQNTIENLKSELKTVKDVNEAKQAEIEEMIGIQYQSVQAFEQQLGLKNEQISLLSQKVQKLIQQLENAKVSSDQLAKERGKLQEQLSPYKKGTKPQFNKKQFEYYLSLSKAKLLEIHAFIKEILQIHSKAGEKGLLTNLHLVRNAETKLASCLGTFEQLQAAYRLP